MSRWKSVEFNTKNKAGTVDMIKLVVNISPNGTFYARVPARLKPSFEKEWLDHSRTDSESGFTVSATSFLKLKRAIERAHDLSFKPTVTTKHVIRYNIESHVSFALTKDGRIFPNAGYDGAEWPRGDRAKDYGDHHSSEYAEGGYSLTVGAEALTKKTTTFGENSSVSYEDYYKGESHLGSENPAQKLNSWVAFSLPDDAKEIPYSDEAAMFFYGLMMGVAELNRRVQEFTNTPEKLALAVSRHSSAMLLGMDKVRK